ncbi:MAG: Z1 domain-containing protein [Thermoanaerobaculia bacterium]|nr:Z1 domain-containing protein [Thermoanaerobaculia bacterium]
MSQDSVIRTAQMLLLDESDRTSINPTIIGEKIDLVLRMNPRWGEGLDRDAVTDELIRRFSLWIGTEAALVNQAGHVAWLNSSRKRGWRYWGRYREWMEGRLSFTAVDALDRATDKILELLEDPMREGPWDRRGLVVGHVQSGKTGNYTGLICKAADAGYKIIIVLAGLHNNLRSQTQMRLDEGFLGYETGPTQDDLHPIGVGEIDSDPAIRPNYATNRSELGDFNTKISKHLGITPEQRPWLFVVKKNKTVLERLLRWLKNHVANSQDPVTKRKVVTNLPLLLIDDEADHASVDTGEQLFDSNGIPDAEHSPTAINQRIRRILHTFSRAAYVGYTATPFANIFIHERGETREEGPDLFPSSFIISLPAPSNYTGPARVFGLQGAGVAGDGLPLVRLIEDHVSPDGKGGWMPIRHGVAHQPIHQQTKSIPPSLIEAIDAFLFSCAVRHLRGQGRAHASMLVHVTRYNLVQAAVCNQVEEHIRNLRQKLTRRIGHEPVLERMKGLWDGDFLPAARRLREQDEDLGGRGLPSWEDVFPLLPDIVSDIQVKTINGTAKDALDYRENEGRGLKVIAIGGDKLARGLTLEGLTVSYFLRASRMYDTLMQMGRWFGYRPGYLDVCRLYTTSDLREWFGHIAEASEELREEFDLMVDSGATPRDYGLKVQSHPVLMVTSRLKMRTARNLMLSFSGQLLESVSLFRDSKVLERNLDATRRLFSGLPAPRDPRQPRPDSEHRWQGYLWEGVPAAEVTDFFSAYQTNPAALKVNSALIAEFILSMISTHELTSWTIAFIGGDGEPFEIAPGLSLGMVTRAWDKDVDQTDRYTIRRLLSPRDEAIDLDSAAWEAALAETKRAWRSDPARLQRVREPDEPNGPSIRRIRGFGADGIPAHPERGLLLIYPLDPRKAGLPDGAPPVIAFGVSFPGSNSGRKVEYKVNNVLWEAEYGPAD